MVLTSCVAAVASEWSIPFTHDQTVLLCLESCTLWMEWVTLRRKHITLLEGRGHLLRHHRSQVMMWAWQICCLYTLAVYHREWNIPEADSLVSLFYLLESEVKVIQSCPTLCDPMDCTTHGILQARILEWVAFPFSRGPPQPRDWTQVLPVDSLLSEPLGKPCMQRT